MSGAAERRRQKLVTDACDDGVCNTMREEIEERLFLSGNGLASWTRCSLLGIKLT